MSPFNNRSTILRRVEEGLIHAGGIYETKIIAGMAEAYYTVIAPQPIGPDLVGSLYPVRRLNSQLNGSGTQYARCRLSQRTFVFKDRLVEFPTEPGGGIELDEEAVADKIDHDGANLQSYDLDDNSM